MVQLRRLLDGDHPRRWLRTLAGAGADEADGQRLLFLEVRHNLLSFANSVEL